MAFLPHTEADVSDMLATIGVADIDSLFDEIPSDLQSQPPASVPEALSEMAIGRLMTERAAADHCALNFIGAGAYEHHVPAAVWSVATRGEFYSAYTPYQAEASQGTLQTVYEYQTMIAQLTAMPVSNASLYDGASALAEACLMALRCHRDASRRRILLPRALHPAYRACARTIGGQQNLEFAELPFGSGDGRTPAEFSGPGTTDNVAAVVIAQPNFFGVLEDVDRLCDWAHQCGAMVIAVVNPLSLGLLKPPGEWGTRGADIVVGEGQPLGVPLASGGPYFGFLATRAAHLRQMPGRVVGRTRDRDGTPCYTLTLQAREQHIRRSQATSNICTNQGLAVTAATIYLALLGAEGLARTAATSMARTARLAALLGGVPGVRRVFETERFHELVVGLDLPAARVIDALAERRIAAGYDLSHDYPELGDALLVCATETKTDADLVAFATALSACLQDLRTRSHTEYRR